MNYVKLFALAALALACEQTILACDVCGVRQPELLQKFTHGSGPSGAGDYVAPALMAIAMLYAFFRAIQCFSKSADRPHQLIKRLILAPDPK